MIEIEDYNPKTVAEATHLDRVIEKIDGKKATLLHGKCGMGKTRLLHIYADEHGYKKHFVNASLSGSIDNLRDNLTQFCEAASLEDRPKMLFLDEIDNASDAFYMAMRGFMDKYEKHVWFVATCNNFGKVLQAGEGGLASRFECVNVEPANDTERKELRTKYANRIARLLKANKIKPEKPIVLEIVKRGYPDWRKIKSMVIDLSKKADDGKDISVDSMDNTITGDYVDIFEAIVTGMDNVELHQMLVAKYSDQTASVLTSLSDKFPNWLATKYPKHASLLEHVFSVISYHVYNMPTSVDQVLPMKACIFELKNIIKSNSK